MHVLKMLYEIFVIILIITYALLVFTDPADHPYLTHEMLHQFDLALIGFLIVELSVRIIRSKDRKQFLKSNWFDIVALVPVDPAFRFARLIRILRLVRIVRSSPLLWGLLKSREMQIILGFAIIITSWSAVGIYFLERGVNDSIQDLGDAFWWAVVTTTTVGYGDIFPVTSSGRIIAGVLMVTGIGLLGTLTANLANHWMEYFGKLDQPNDHTETHSFEKQMVLDKLQYFETLDDEAYDEMLKLMKHIRETSKNGE